MSHFDATSGLFQRKINIPNNTKVIFVADMFLDEYIGGAELTTDALIKSADVETFKIKAKDLDLQTLEAGSGCFWIFTNFAAMNPNLIPTIVANLSYSIIEYDYKYCKHRSPDKHFVTENMPCDCHNQLNGKLVSAFFHGAKNLWWMSERQKDRYVTLFPFLAEKSSVVLSSVFDNETIAKMKLLRSKTTQSDRKGWIVLGSPSWIKGTVNAEAWCQTNGVQYEKVSNLSYDNMLAKLASSEGLVYMPPGGDTCPRLVIEAKLLGCKLQLNNNVEHQNEEWFATEDLHDIEDYLFASKTMFWNAIKTTLNTPKPTISGYTTTLNCIKQQYPYIQCIKSLASFCDEVVVVDGGSDDGTHQTLVELQKTMPEVLKITSNKIDLSAEHFAVFDGQQKALARSLCTKDFCWQMDCDEIVHEDDVEKIRSLCEKIPKNVDIISLPVIEFWGSTEKVRMDVQAWKWRLSRNLPHITHGIPVNLRRFDEKGKMYAMSGTDGCDMIDITSGEPLYHFTFLTATSEHDRVAGLNGDEVARQGYQKWFNIVAQDLPSVFHYSWIDLERKIKLYRSYWTRHWVALGNEKYVDLAETNMMFDAPWSVVTDDMIKSRVEELKQIGGWIWHKKWDGTKTPWITCDRAQPASMIGYVS